MSTTTTANPGRLLFVRHGETPANTAQVWHGQIDTPLTETGEAQRQALGAQFHRYGEPDVIYASTLQRARLTAEAIAERHSLEVLERPALMEFHIGEWENQTYERLTGELNFFAQMLEDENYTAPGGESRADVTRRFTAEVAQIQAAHRDETVVIVAHGMALSFAFAHWLTGDSANWLDYRMGNTAVTELQLLPEAAMVNFNQALHL